MVGNRQVRHDLCVLTSVGLMRRELDNDEIGETPQLPVPIGREPQDLVTEPVGADKAVLEGGALPEDRLEPGHDRGIKLVERDEGEEHRHVGWHSPAGHRVQIPSDLAHGRLDLGHLHDERRPQSTPSSSHPTIMAGHSGRRREELQGDVVRVPEGDARPVGRVPDPTVADAQAVERGHPGLELAALDREGDVVQPGLLLIERARGGRTSVGVDPEESAAVESEDRVVEGARL